MYLGRIVEAGTVGRCCASRSIPTRARLAFRGASTTAGLRGEGSVVRLPGETPSPARPPTIVISTRAVRRRRMLAGRHIGRNPAVGNAGRAFATSTADRARGDPAGSAAVAVPLQRLSSRL